MLDFLSAIDELHEILAVGSVVLVSALALILGRGPERAAGLVLLIDAFGLVLLAGLLDQGDRVVLVHAKAVLVLGAYVVMTIRWHHRWLVLLAGLQAFAVLLHLVAWIDRSIVIFANALLLNATGWLMLLVLAVATVGNAFRRRDVRAGL
ncbi:hypothetical protein [Brevundimonas sp.]|uniref:hypothetical protein n=1 Tax=Brevundimonas sp. TaxID=1871086 RepID=UPI002FC6082B